MAVNYKSVGALALAASSVIFAFRQLGSKSDVVESTNSGPTTNIDNLDDSGTYPELINQSEEKIEPVPLSLDNGDRWWEVNYTEEDKKKNREDAKRVLGTLDDYTFKFFLPCTVGTGWILDYQLTNDGSYPTKWYIATNAHVIWRLSFSENRYNQLLPKQHTWAKSLRDKSKEQIQSISGDKEKVRTNCGASDEYGYFDMNISQEKTWEAGRHADVGGVANKQMYEPRLFYSAFNFIDAEVARKHDMPTKHFADFAILEIEFTNSQAAKEATNGFADKYKVGGEVEPIKFGRSIEKRYETKKELWEAKDNYFILAYPVVEGKEAWKHTHNFDDNTTFASHLVGNGWDYDRVGRPNKYRGFAAAKDITLFGTAYMQKFIWHGEEFKEFGHYYGFDHNSLDGGASGGLFVDNDGHAVGVIVQIGGNKTWAQPFRSEGIEGDGFKTPGYDLILGGFQGQRSSYRQQVQEHILDKGRETWLSKSGRLQTPTKN